jgi:hypothetical protein
MAKGYRAFWSSRLKPSGFSIGDEIIVLKTTDHYAIVKAKRTYAETVPHSEILSRLRKWEKSFEFEVVGASHDWVAIAFRTLPKNLCAFAEEVYRFCPDIVDQGVGPIREKDNPKFFAEARKLCPKLSRSAQQSLAKESKQAERLIKESPTFSKIMAALKKLPGFGEDSTEMGIKLLANEIRTKKHLFLWWD